MMKLAAFLFLCLFMTGCTHLLYPAERRPFYDHTKIRPRPTEALIPLDPLFSATGGQLNTWFFPSQVPQRRGLVLHFHGNGQNLTTHFLFFMWMVNNGYDYMIFDYRGYGASSDSSASPEKTVQDGMTMLKYVREHNPGLPIIAIGQSLGSNVLVRSLQELNAKDSLKKYLPDMVVLESSFLSYKQAASSVLSQRWFLYLFKPIAYLGVSDSWSAIKNLENSPAGIPALYFHGTKDPTINYDLGRDNFSKWKGPKVFVDLANGGHISAFNDERFYKSSGLKLLSCIDAGIKKTIPFESCTNTEAP